MPFATLSASARGASHIRLGKPNQDAVRCFQSETGLPTILSVADGHGGARYFRSGEGARIAVETATAVLLEMLPSVEGSYQIAKDNVEKTIPRVLLSRWRDAVRAHRDINPYTESELTPENTEALSQNEWTPYGTTLLCALILETRVIFWQIGDGDILAVTGEGELFMPLGRDERFLAGETTSLCLPEAVNEFRVFMRGYQEPLSFIMLATDGYANSFRTLEGFWKVATDINAMLREGGIDDVHEALPAWLADTSREGSGDDITVAIALHTT